MSVFDRKIAEKLLKNGAINKQRRYLAGEAEDFPPVVRIIGGKKCSWLLSEVDPDDNDTAFGLCNIGNGKPELGTISIRTLLSFKYKPDGRGVQRDKSFVPKKTLIEYAIEETKQERNNNV